jgi:hypothetical protein
MVTKLALIAMLLGACVAQEDLDLAGTSQHATWTRILLPGGGTAQSQQVMSTFEQPLGMYVHDSYGRPLAGVPVRLTAPAGGPTASLGDGGVAVTDDDGFASLVAHAGALAGIYAIEAATEGAPPIVFALRNIAGGAAVVLPVTGTAQSAPSATSFDSELVVEVRDAYGNPVGGQEVAFAAPAHEPTATLAATCVVTDEDGRAHVAAIAGAQSGTYVVTARVAGSTVPFVLTNGVRRPRLTPGWVGPGEIATAYR